MNSRYQIDFSPDDDGFDIVRKIAKKRGFLISGGEADIERAAAMLLDEFRGGKLGRITLEFPL
jgi:ribosome biogenesis GTPase A